MTTELPCFVLPFLPQRPARTDDAVPTVSPLAASVPPPLPQAPGARLLAQLPLRFGR